LQWADFDNDGNLDLAVLGSAALRIYHNNANGTFSLTATLLSDSNSSYGKIIPGDYDNDGRLDLLVFAGIAAKIVRNNGSGGFSDIGVSFPVLGGTGDWADLDNDGDLDILIAGVSNSSQTNITQIYLNNGDGTFTKSTQYLLGVASGFAVLRDLDRDGDFDILLSGATNYMFGGPAGPYATTIYRNDNGLFSEVPSPFPALVSGKVATGDYNNDGNLDVFLQDGQGFSRLFRNESGLAFTDTGISLDQTVPVVWADFDNDGSLDFLQTAYVEPSFRILLYRNQNQTSNSIPLPPSGLDALPSGRSVDFRWCDAVPNHAQQFSCWRVAIGGGIPFKQGRPHRRRR